MLEDPANAGTAAVQPCLLDHPSCREQLTIVAQDAKIARVRIELVPLHLIGVIVWVEKAPFLAVH